MEKFGFVGLPNAGKSSLYNALAGGGALAAPYAFATTDPNVGVAKVFDERLDALAEMSSSKKLVHASVQFNDIGGLVAGASKGEGLGNKFLSGIREVDAIVFVLRAFRDDDVPGPQDPIEHLEVVEIELTLADLETIEKQIDKRRKAAKGDKSLLPEVEAMAAALVHLEAGTPLYRSDLSDENRELLRPWLLLTNKPVLAIVNVDEEQLASVDEIIAPVEAALGDVAPVFGACIQLEAEAAQLDPDDRAEMLDALGLGEGTVPRFIATAYMCSDCERSSRPGPRSLVRGPIEWGRRRPNVLARSIRISNAASSEPRPSAGMSWSRSVRGQKLATSARSVRKARTTSSRMEMCSISDSTSDLPGEACWLVRDGVVLASLVVTRTRRERGRGLLGRDSLVGAILIDPARSVHTIGMAFDIDVAFLDADLTVLKVRTMKRSRVSIPVRGCRSILEAEAGAFGSWGLATGDELEVRHLAEGDE